MQSNRNARVANGHFASGFTLIELLVVISIIALLIALLLPALSRAREQTNALACMSNVRQMAIASAAVINDTNGEFPGQSVSGPYAAQWPKLLMPYLSNDQVFVCPIQLGNNPGPVNTYLANGVVWLFWFTDVYHGTLNEGPTRIEEVRQPSKVVLFYESQNDVHWYFPDRMKAGSQAGILNLYKDSVGYTQMIGRHFYGGDAGNGDPFGSDNYAFIDGHAGTYDMKEYVRNSVGWMYNYPFYSANIGMGFPPSLAVRASGPPGPLGEFWFVPSW